MWYRLWETSFDKLFFSMVVIATNVLIFCFFCFQVQDGQEQVVLPEAQILTSSSLTNKCLKNGFWLLTLYWLFFVYLTVLEEKVPQNQINCICSQTIRLFVCHIIIITAKFSSQAQKSVLWWTVLESHEKHGTNKIIMDYLSGLYLSIFNM